MKSFRLYKSDFRKALKIFGVFKLFKNKMFLIVLMVLIVGLAAGTFGGVYLTPLLISEDKVEEQQDLFLETQPELTKNNKQELKSAKTIKSIPDVVKEVSPAVVSVIASKIVPVIERGYINPFGENSPFDVRIPVFRQKGEELKEIGGGSGLIVSSNGLIVTNKHVVLDEDAQYTVLTNDGEKYEAVVLDRDPIQDVAVLKIDINNLPIVKLGDSDNLEIGQTVIAIGNALGQFRNTVSAGVVSGLLRTITATGGGITEQLEEVIQTDAAINKGNSGGPLLNLYGEVIGINTAVAQEAENIGFAIPINKVKKAITDVQTRGKIVYPFLGVRYVLITQAIAKANNLPVNYGALILQGDANNPAIILGSAAQKAGLKENDIILEIDNKKITEKLSLAKIILQYNPGDTIMLRVLRDDEYLNLRAVLDEWE